MDNNQEIYDNQEKAEKVVSPVIKSTRKIEISLNWKTLFLILGLLFVGSVAYSGAHALNSQYDDYHLMTVEKDLSIGMPAYSGPCPEIITQINTAYGKNRYLNQHSSLNGLDNLNFYKTNILGNINGAFSYAQFCEDVEAQGRLLFATANITLDLAIDKAMSYKEAVLLAKSYYGQADSIGYNKKHPLESAWLGNRIKRNEIRAKLKASV